MKKFLSLALVTVMALSAVACGQSSEPENNAAEAEETADGAAGGETFKIGGIGPTTGGAAVYGTNAMNGAQIAVDEINAAGGING